MTPGTRGARHRCDPEQLEFESTAELAPLPDGSINQLVEARLAGMAEVARRFGARDDSDRSHD